MFQPVYRPRRLRSNENIRRMVRETTLSPDDFIYPLFVTHGKGCEERDRGHARELSAVH